MTSYLMKHATIMDIKARTKKTCDLLIEDGIIAKMEETIGEGHHNHIIDLAGTYLTSGWIDAHTHFYQIQDSIGVDADTMMQSGVTCTVDAGSSGPENFRDFLERNIRTSTLCGKAYLNLARMGLSGQYEELKHLSEVDLDLCERVLTAYPDELLGIKLRIDPRVCEDEISAMKLAVKLKERVKCPIVVHASRCRITMEQLLKDMADHDILAHSFAAKTPGLLDENGRVKFSVWEARRRGVQFDLSHGNSNFSFTVAEQAIAQGFLPDAISTDLHKRSERIVQSLPTTMNKLLACGMELWDVLDCVTGKAASMIGLKGRPTTLAVGQPADLTAFTLEEGQFVWQDSERQVRKGKKRIVPRLTMLNEKIVQN